jgi:opacity protein-like surface antigen
MKIFKFYLIASALLVTANANAQKSPGSQENADSKFSFSLGAGSANYFGDLIDKDVTLSQVSLSFSTGLKYAITSNLAARLDVGVQKLQGSDSKSGGAHPERNLSFKSNTVDFALAAEYTILNSKKFKLSPYIFAGVGVVLFNPYAQDAFGNKQSLPELQTEGRSYSTAALEFPLGAGVKYRINDDVSFGLEFNYRITRTDYLDDVSRNSYPSKASLDARNPLTSKFTYRGNEVGGPAWPGATLPRGNPDNNDAFLTTQLKLVFKL